MGALIDRFGCDMISRSILYCSGNTRISEAIYDYLKNSLFQKPESELPKFPPIPETKPKTIFVSEYSLAGYVGNVGSNSNSLSDRIAWMDFVSSWELFGSQMLDCKLQIPDSQIKFIRPGMVLKIRVQAFET